MKGSAIQASFNWHTTGEGKSIFHSPKVMIFSGEPIPCEGGLQFWDLPYFRFSQILWIFHMDDQDSWTYLYDSAATVSSPDLLSVWVGLKPTKVWNRWRDEVIVAFDDKTLPLKSTFHLDLHPFRWSPQKIILPFFGWGYRKKGAPSTPWPTCQGPVAKECAELWPKIASCAPAICWVVRLPRTGLHLLGEKRSAVHGGAGRWM